MFVGANALVRLCIGYSSDTGDKGRSPLQKCVSISGEQSSPLRVSQTQAMPTCGRSGTPAPTGSQTKVVPICGRSGIFCHYK